MTTVTIPAPVGEILKTLEAAGYGAWCVGGCVRDALLDRMPGGLGCDHFRPAGGDYGPVCRPGCPNWSAPRHRHRKDGAGWRRDHYTPAGRCLSGHRRPETVTFTDSLEEDLRRRDFTINAMAADLQGTLYDPLGGRADLTEKVLRCVGEPDRRFGEDALRILRGLRFAAELGVTVHPDTAGGHPPEPGIAESHCSGADLGGAEKAGVRKMGRRGPAGLSGCGWRLLAGDSAHGGV